MDRRSGLKKAHFSSVPTRMSLFTCKKYVFLIKKTFPPPPPPKNRKNSTQRSLLCFLCQALPLFFLHKTILS
ncbi:Hypothetical protein G436_2433 [Leptospira interrogans serovar Hardjo str. Norma]|uniref:Uncharacterized protein n=2 Tax=Leptospira interrogans serovar Hardjo str. Norma TaxID=1279460 RepID=A0A0M4MUE0_LEPIR|nr:Hypothetical protein G436_2433 [Leptospira interrogans serovar Hardjo str. Norma]